MFNDPSGAEPYNPVNYDPAQSMPNGFGPGGPHGYTDNGGNWNWNDPTGDAQSYLNIGMGHIYSDQRNTSKYMESVKARANAQYESYLRASGQLETVVGYHWNGIEDKNGNLRSFEITGFEFAQQEDQEYLKNFLLGNFGNEIRALNHLARETGQKLAWWIDVEGKYASDPGIPGDTRRIKERQTTYISIHAYPLASAMTGDSRLLYVVVAHELVHAADILNGNRDFWNGWYGEDMGHKIMEHHAYTRSAALETQLGVNCLAQISQIAFYFPHSSVSRLCNV